METLDKQAFLKTLKGLGGKTFGKLPEDEKDTFWWKWPPTGPSVGECPSWWKFGQEFEVRTACISCLNQMPMLIITE